MFNSFFTCLWHLQCCTPPLRHHRHPRHQNKGAEVGQVGVSDPHPQQDPPLPVNQRAYRMKAQLMLTITDILKRNRTYLHGGLGVVVVVQEGWQTLDDGIGVRAGNR